MDHETKTRLGWIKLYQETNDAGLTCRKCGISRPTLRKWLSRYQESGEKGLSSQSRKPHHSPQQKVFEKEENWILSLRNERHLGVRHIKHELFRLHEFHLSFSTIQKVLKRHQAKPLRRTRRKRKYRRYEKTLPGERVQIDTIKIAPGIYQYCAFR